MASFTGLKDMFDGGGAGKSGAKFEGGGVLSALGNAVARPSGSRDRGEADMRTGFGGFARDMFNGGGFGASGETFQGGPYGGIFGGLLNSIGVRPMGYEQRGQQQLQQALANAYQMAQQGQRAAAAAPTSSAPMTSPRPPSINLPVNMPVQPVSRALYGQNVPFGGYALPQPAIQSVTTPVPAPVMTPPAPTGPVVGTSPQHTSMWNKLFPNGLY